MNGKKCIRLIRLFSKNYIILQCNGSQIIQTESNFWERNPVLPQCSIPFQMYNSLIQLTMNAEAIGTWAGLVWTALNDKDVVVGFKQLKKETKLKKEEIFAAVGWLAREGKVEIQTNPDDEKDLLFALVQDK